MVLLGLAIKNFVRPPAMSISKNRKKWSGKSSLQSQIVNNKRIKRKIKPQLANWTHKKTADKNRHQSLKCDFPKGFCKPLQCR